MSVDILLLVIKGGITIRKPMSYLLSLNVSWHLALATEMERSIVQ